MTVKKLAHMLNKECYLGMIELDNTSGNYYPRGILYLRDNESIETIEQIGDLWEIENIDVSSEGNLLTITYKREG